MTDKQIIFRLDSDLSKRLEDRLKEKGMTRQYLFSKVVQLFLEDKLSFDNSNDSMSHDNSLITIDSSEVEMAVRKLLPELAAMIANDNSLITEVTERLKNNAITGLSNDNIRPEPLISVENSQDNNQLSNDNNFNAISELSNDSTRPEPFTNIEHSQDDNQLSNDSNFNAIMDLSNDNINPESLTNIEHTQDNNQLSNDSNLNDTSSTIKTDKIDGQLSLMDISLNSETSTQQDIQPPVTVKEAKPTENEFREAQATECGITPEDDNVGLKIDSEEGKHKKKEFIDTKKRVYELIGLGKKDSQIARILQEEGFPTKQGKTKWANNQVARIREKRNTDV